MMIRYIPVEALFEDDDGVRPWRVLDLRTQTAVFTGTKEQVELWLANNA